MTLPPVWREGFVDHGQGWVLEVTYQGITKAVRVGTSHAQRPEFKKRMGAESTLRGWFINQHGLEIPSRSSEEPSMARALDITLEFAQRGDCLDRIEPIDFYNLVKERDQLREKLESALNGLKWWEEMYPSSWSKTDDEFRAECEALLYGEENGPSS